MNTFYDKYNNKIEVGDLIHIYVEGFYQYKESDIELDNKLKKYAEKNNEEYESIFDKNKFEEVIENGSKIYYVLDKDNNRSKWINDLEKEVLLINNVMVFGFEGGVTFLNSYKKEDLEIIKKNI